MKWGTKIALQEILFLIKYKHEDNIEPLIITLLFYKPTEIAL